MRAYGGGGRREGAEEVQLLQLGLDLLLRELGATLGWRGAHRLLMTVRRLL